jgi:hypothetical protein
MGGRAARTAREAEAMTTLRCYVPVTLEQLTRLRDERTLAGPLSAYAVTAAVRAANPSGEGEEWEYAALQEAARGLVTAGAPVLIAAVDIEQERVRPGASSDAGVEVGDIDLPRIAALHLGDDVVGGQPEAVASSDDVELSWYDTTELAHVIELAQAVTAGRDPV